MRPIPKKVREQIDADPFYKTCIHEKFRGISAKGRITIEHCWIYAGKQINQLWALVPCSWEKNVGAVGETKEFNQYVSLLRAKSLGAWEQVLEEFPRKNWEQEFTKLHNKFYKIWEKNIPQKGRAKRRADELVTIFD